MSDELSPEAWKAGRDAMDRRLTWASLHWPELVEVVAEVLAEHSGVVWDSLGTAVFCSDCLDGDEPAPFGDADKWLAQHQARAVLAALTEAGTVEWGVQGKTFVDEDWDAVWSKDHTNRPLTEDGAKNHLWLKSPVPFRVVSRLTLPWAEVAE